MNDMYTILTEASGSLTSGYLLNSIKDAGYKSVASDIDENSWAKYYADKFILMPSVKDLNLWIKIKQLLSQNKVDVVLPSLDETLEGWSLRVEEFSDMGVRVITSQYDTIRICQDKWLTYKFFQENCIPTAATSLEQIYPLVKPRLGRGGVGVQVTNDKVSMDGMISQELLGGQEFTVDVFCDFLHNPVYILPRKRLGVKDGKSTGGIVENVPLISTWVEKICSKLKFLGPINIQCFLNNEGRVSFTEINPRVGGGMALAFAASENWIDLIVDNIINHKEVVPKPIKYGLQMKRFYAEIFIPSS